MAETAAGPLNQVAIGRGFAISTTAGWMSVNIARFLPDQRDIRVGDTITWTATDTVTNHTVTFGPEPANPAPASSNVVNGEATLPTSPPGLTVNSGFLKANASPFAAKQFSVTFTAPGTYTYICALHDDLGMRGTIVVH
jgi:plastocyanin